MRVGYHTADWLCLGQRGEGVAREPDAADDSPRWIRRVGQLSWRLLGAGLLLWLLAELVQKLTLIVVPVAIALLLAAVLHPLVRRFDREGLPPWLVPLATVLTLLVVLTAGTLAIGVRISEQLPELRDDFQTSLEDLEQRYSIELPSLPGTDGSSGSPSASDATEAVRLGGEILFGLFLVLALTFLFLKDGEQMWRWFIDKVDDGVRDEVDATGRAAWGTLGTYVRGLTVVALFDAIGIGLGLLALGVPLVVTLAALQFLASYIPTIGAFVAGGIAVIVAFGTDGLGTAALVVVLVVLVQQIGNDVIEPWIMGRSLPISPAVVLIAVSTGGILWGIAGALLLVPFTAAVTAASHEIWQRRQTGRTSPDG